MNCGDSVFFTVQNFVRPAFVVSCNFEFSLSFIFAISFCLNTFHYFGGRSSIWSDSKCTNANRTATLPSSPLASWLATPSATYSIIPLWLFSSPFLYDWLKNTFLVYTYYGYNTSTPPIILEAKPILPPRLRWSRSEKAWAKYSPFDKSSTRSLVHWPC